MSKLRSMFSKITDWFFKRRILFFSVHALWIIILQYLYNSRSDDPAVFEFLTLVAPVTVDAFVPFALFWPVVTVREIKKGTNPPRTAEQEIALFLALVIMPPLLLLRAILIQGNLNLDLISQSIL